MQNRIKYMDIAKGIGMLMVLVGHTYAGFLCSLANSFHMPLFFIISGYFFKPSQRKELIKKGYFRLLIPYLFTCFLFIGYSVFGDIINHSHEALKWLWGGIYGCGWDYTEPFYIKGTGGIWFLLTMFWTLLILNDVLKLKQSYQCICVLVLAYVGHATYAKFVLPWSIQNAMIAVLFCYFGYALRKYELFKTGDWFWNIVILIIWFFGLKYFGFIMMVNCSIPSIMTLISAVCGSLIVIIASSHIEKVPLLRNLFVFCGQSTVTILCFHIFELHTGILVKPAEILSVHMEFDMINILFALRLCWGLAWAYIAKRNNFFKNIFFGR